MNTHVRASIKILEKAKIASVKYPSMNISSNCFLVFLLLHFAEPPIFRQFLYCNAIHVFNNMKCTKYENCAFLYRFYYILYISRQIPESVTIKINQANRESYMSAHVLLNLLNQKRKRDKMWI